MVFIRHLIRKLGLKSGLMLIIVGAIASSLLLLIVWIGPSTAQMLKPLSGEPTPKAIDLDQAQAEGKLVPYRVKFSENI